MNNNINKNYNNLKYFNPDRQKGCNFYIWEYTPTLTIDLSVSFCHKILVPNDINIYFKNPRAGYFYIFQLEVAYLKKYNFLNSTYIRINPNLYPYFQIGIHEPFDVSYFIFLCRPTSMVGYQLIGIWHNLYLRPI